MLTYDDILVKGEQKIRDLGLYGPVIAGVETGYILRHNREVLDRYVFEQAAINAEVADSEIEMFGKRFDTPVMTAAITSPIPRITENGLYKVAKGVKKAGAMMWLGSPILKNLEDIVKIAPPIGQIIKPMKDRANIYEALDFIERAGLLR